MSSDDDYMKIQIPEAAPTTESYSKKRNNSKLASIQKNKKSKSEAVKLEYAKQQPLTVENKGFQMLQKLGFKPGSALGKGGLNEPIQVEIKNDRVGLGKTDTVKVKTENRLQKEKQEEAFVEKMSMKQEKRLLELDLQKARLAIMAADEQVSKKSIYWLQKNQHVGIDGYCSEVIDVVDSVQEEFEASSDSNKLYECIQYLRKNYFYCIWCSSTFTDMNDMLENCPGNTRILHED